MRTKCAAAHWAGPRPTTPLLWSALDFGNSISAEVRKGTEAPLGDATLGCAIRATPPP